ncbi:MAG: HlyD family efflux transporter periplasmic adaptor subunit [Magnetococcales bacterium]|nr:HlyD family efflux transporter periplasmic adaptor subunit [Magnetococcales bacterium]
MDAKQPVGESVKITQLRKDLTIYPGPRSSMGSPTWSLHDPARNCFFRLGWSEFEILSRLDIGDLQQISDRVNSETTLHTTPQQVTSLIQFLEVNNLMIAAGEEGFNRLCKQLEAKKKSLFTWILHTYLFFRLPLVKPDNFLKASLPLVSWMFSRGFFYFVLFTALVGLYLIARQWEAFIYTFSHLFTWEGALLFGMALVVVKVVHELGHGYSARYYGCHVPTMGVAFLVMMPVLYTDTSEAWKLQSKKKRLVIGASGMLAELILAVIATLSWSFLPDGPVRSATLFVATTSWVMTLIVNLSPFLRFDGYYLLSDRLDIQNLHERATAMGKWFLRSTLLGLQQPCPEVLTARKRKFLIIFAYTTWLYRLILFLGIALLVYHLFFKVAGIVLMVVEILWFIILPITREIKYWTKERENYGLNRNITISGLLFGLVVLLLIYPWKTSVEVPAILRIERHTKIFSPASGQINLFNLKEGDSVHKGDMLIKMVSKEAEYKLQQTKLEIDLAQWKLEFQGMDQNLIEQSPVIQQELESKLTQLNGLQEQKSKMTITAPFSGRVVTLSEHLKEGTWVAENEPLLELVHTKGWIIEAYIEESDLSRIYPGVSAVFYPEILDWPTIDGSVVTIDSVGTRELNDPYLVSTMGGDIPVREGEKGEWLPQTPIYRLILHPNLPANLQLDKLLRGSVILDGKPQSYINRAWKAVLAVYIRESGF